MQYCDVSTAMETLHNLQSKLAAYNHAMGVLSLDASTAAPKGTSEGRGRTMAVLSEVTYGIIADPENEPLLSFLEEHLQELNPQEKREVELWRKSFNEISRIPAKEYIEYTVLINDAQDIWPQAKQENNFALFAPYLEKIIEFNRKFAGYYHPEMKTYDALLNEYEEGLTTEMLDGFFAMLRKELVPLINKIKEAKAPEDCFLHKYYPVDKQREFSDYLMEVLGLDRNHCGIAETEHPYTTNFNCYDVRITTHYQEHDLASSMYSVIHEGGHAIYELGCDPKYNYTMLSGGVSMGIHESQSRFFENIIGRSEPFIRSIFPKMQELFPEQLQGVDAHMFWKAVNKAGSSLIRTEADELTYCMHIMVRYEIEKRLIDGSLAVKDLPQAWNEMYQQYLGIEVPDDQNGCLQDCHWSGGSIGYFPSYALGSAYGPQMLAFMEKDLGDIWQDVERGDLSRIKGWLGEHFHRHAGFYKPGVLFEMSCGKFGPTYYTNYLKEKYEALYNL